MTTKLLLAVVLGLHLWVQCCVADIDYTQALIKSILYFEAQRSGKLPADQRVLWRGDSGLKDGKDAGIDLAGGYYDAGDNVKFGFPMAFTVTMLAWSVVEYSERLYAKSQYGNTRKAVQWGADYLLKAHTNPTELYVQVGDGQSDHECWERPEDMTTPRNSYKIDASHPGSDVAAETAAALAASSIVFAKFDQGYSATLLNHSRQLYDFANKHRGLYQNSVPSAGAFYASSGDDDELAWAAAWLYLATGEKPYLKALASADDGGVRTMFSWDDKWLGVQTLVSKLIMTGKVPGSSPYAEFKDNAEEFFCNMMQNGNNNVKMSSAGMLWWSEWNDFQYTTTSLLAHSVYADYLAVAKSSLSCTVDDASPQKMIQFAQSQANYILGANPKNMSYMVGLGSSFPQKVHHRGASIISIKKDPTQVTCKGGYDAWFNKDAPDPNQIDGAIVGGPGMDDQYSDARSNFQQAEPATANTGPFVGVLARLATPVLYVG